MRQKGEHTWDIVHQYHRCPKCGAILESREDYHNHSGKLEKNLICYRCSQKFTVIKRSRPFSLFTIK